MYHSNNDFRGRHEDEVVLYKVKSHPLSEQVKYLKVILATLSILVGVLAVSSTFPKFGAIVTFWGLMLALVVLVIGFWITRTISSKSASYITDRRVVRFTAVSPFAVNSRSLSWEEVVKVKTFSPNILWKILNAGSVVVHAKSTVITSDEPKTKTTITDDDLELADVHYYEDLGNYLDKVLYLYRKRPDELQSIRTFVAKPRGKRY